MLDLVVEEGDAGRELAQGQPDDSCEAVVIGSDAERFAGPEQLAAGQVPQPGAQLVGGGHEHGADLVDRLGAARPAP